MLAARARGLGTAWTTLHLRYEQEVAELLGLPEHVRQGALMPTAYYTGETFRPAAAPAAGAGPAHRRLVKLSYPGGRLRGVPTSSRRGPVIGTLSTIVIDCPEPLALARFYSELTGLPITNQDDDWVDVGDGQPRLAFQLAPDHQPPQWPDPARPQQFHLDVRVDDVEVSGEGGARARGHPAARRG